MRDESLKVAEATMAETGRFRDAVYRAVVNERKHTLAYKLCRLRHKLIWFGGWEKANCGGWRFRLSPGHWMDRSRCRCAAGLHSSVGESN